MCNISSCTYYLVTLLMDTKYFMSCTNFFCTTFYWLRGLHPKGNPFKIKPLPQQVIYLAYTPPNSNLYITKSHFTTERLISNESKSSSSIHEMKIGFLFNYQAHRQGDSSGFNWYTNYSNACS